MRFAFTAIVGILLFTAGAKPAEAGVTIERIEESALNDLMEDRSNRMLLNFMAAWCGPCIDELPVLNRLYAKYKKQGIKFIGISIDQGGPAAMQPTVHKLKIDFPVYWFGEKAINKFKLNAIPMLIFIRQGKVVERLPGRRPESQLDKKIKQLLN